MITIKIACWCKRSKIDDGSEDQTYTRLTYNCAHLRSTKESLMFEYFAIYFFKERYDKIIFNFKSHLEQVFSTKHYNIYIFGLTHFADVSLIRNLFIIPRKDNMMFKVYLHKVHKSSN